MITHLREIFWALKILRDQKIFVLNKLSLWKKSVLLYLSFLAFTDKPRLIAQLHRAMICALITAVYDYETDKVKIGKEQFGSAPFFLLLEDLIKPISQEAYELAVSLFAKDHANQLSKSGIERGGVAFYFYSLIIDSDWLHKYTRDELEYFGSMLQILDDLLDLSSDYICQDKNFFLDQEIAKDHAEQLLVFMQSLFWKELKDNSWLYKYFESKAKKSLGVLGFSKASLKSLYFVGRPLTGVFAAVLTFTGFSFYLQTDWTLAVFTAISGFVFTISIMIHNDVIDSQHDHKKGKHFASEHRSKLKHYDILLIALSLLLIGLICFCDLRLGIFCLACFLPGIIYSHIIRLFLVNQLIVAVCSAAPVLCGMISQWSYQPKAMIAFLIFCSLIFIRELYKDIEDRIIDAGYKATIPTKLGHTASVLYSFALCYLPVVFILLFPNFYVRIVAILMAVVEFRQAMMLFDPKKVIKAKKTISFVLFVLLLAMLIF
jgi:4-hydroxybenzoate polyprenyltransferase